MLELRVATLVKTDVTFILVELSDAIALDSDVDKVETALFVLAIFTLRSCVSFATIWLLVIVNASLIDCVHTEFWVTTAADTLESTYEYVVAVSYTHLTLPTIYSV